MGAKIIKSVKIALVQDSPGSGIREPYERLLKDFRPDILAFPEYYFVGPQYLKVADSYMVEDNTKALLLQWSRDLDCAVVGGSMVADEGGRRFNRSYLIERGQIVGHYDKIHLFRNEGQGTLSPGFEYRVFEFGLLRLGILICADVLFPDTFRNIRGLRPDIIFVPNTSQFQPGESIEVKFRRDIDLFAKGAAAANAIIIKVSASGQIAGRPLQGRSLIAFPGRIAWRVEPENEDKSALILATLAGNVANPSLDIEVHRS